MDGKRRRDNKMRGEQGKNEMQRWQGSTRGRCVGDKKSLRGSKRKKKRGRLKGLTFEENNQRKAAGMGVTPTQIRVVRRQVGVVESTQESRNAVEKRKTLRRRIRQRRRVQAQGLIWCTVTSEVGNTKMVRTWAKPGEKGTRENNQSAGGLGTRHRGTDYSARRIMRRGIGLMRTDRRRGVKRNRKRRRKQANAPYLCVQRDGKGKGSRGRKKRVRELSRKVRTVGNRSREPHNGCRGKGKRSV